MVFSECDFGHSLRFGPYQVVTDVFGLFQANIGGVPGRSCLSAGQVTLEWRALCNSRNRRGRPLMCGWYTIEKTVPIVRFVVVAGLSFSVALSDACFFTLSILLLMPLRVSKCWASLHC